MGARYKVPRIAYLLEQLGYESEETFCADHGCTSLIAFFFPSEGEETYVDRLRWVNAALQERAGEKSTRRSAIPGWPPVPVAISEEEEKRLDQELVTLFVCSLAGEPDIENLAIRLGFASAQAWVESYGFREPIDIFTKPGAPGRILDIRCQLS